MIRSKVGGVQHMENELNKKTRAENKRIGIKKWTCRCL